MRRTALALALLLLAAPALAQNQIAGGVIAGVGPASAPSCAGSPDLSTVLVSTTHHAAATCTTAAPNFLAAYTHDQDAADTYDYKDGMVWAEAQAPASPDDCGWYTTPTVKSGHQFFRNPTCVYTTEVSSSTDDCEFTGEAVNGTTGWNHPGNNGQIMFEFNHNPGTDTAFAGSPNIIQVGAGDTSLTVSVIGDELRFRWDPNAGSNVDLTTSGDTTSDCCNGGPCENFITADNAMDNAVVYFAVEFETGLGAGSDYVKVYANFSDGTSDADSGAGTDYTSRCLILSSTSLTLNNNSWAAAELWRMGNVSGGGDDTDWRMGSFWIVDDPLVDMWNLLSGGDGDMQDGDECACGDVGGGTDCAG